MVAAQDPMAARIEHAGNEPQNWLTYYGNYGAWSYSPLNQIARENVKQIVPVWAFPAGYPKCVHFPLDEYEWILPRRFDLIMTAISKLIRSRNVLVHCGAGVSRSPVVVALYLHIIGYKNFDDALFELRNLRPVVAPSKLILERAKAYLEGLI
jgi:protein-tyrosine phosphatase